MKKLSIIISGPTGVGKTDIAEKLISVFPNKFVMVNVDLGQFYVPLNIGTAKPANLENYDNALFDILNEPIDWNVAKFRSVLKDTLNSIWDKNKIPILVGGSSFYVKAFFYKPSSVNTIKYAPQDLSTLDLWNQLYEIDSHRAEKISKNDRYRIERALTIWQSTGRQPSEFKAEFSPLSDFIFTFVNRDRTELYDKINKRTEIMLRSGWIEEVSSLGLAWKEFLFKKKLIGYPEIIEYLEQNSSFEDLVALIAQKTRNYAKRQVTFLKGLQRQIRESLVEYVKENPDFYSITEDINLTFTQIDLYINDLSKEIKNYLNR